jgi:WD40-like Beta Propeller Repeat
VRPVADRRGPEFDAAWAPDGRWIVYRDSRRGINENDEIYVPGERARICLPFYAGDLAGGIIRAAHVCTYSRARPGSVPTPLALPSAGQRRVNMRVRTRTRGLETGFAP